MTEQQINYDMLTAYLLAQGWRNCGHQGAPPLFECWANADPRSIAIGLFIPLRDQVVLFNCFRVEMLCKIGQFERRDAHDVRLRILDKVTA